MRALLSALLACSLLAAPLFAQQNEEEQKAVQRQIKLQSLQSQLEDLRRKRDKIVVDRWEERRAANEKREELNRRLEEARLELETAGERKSRLMDDLRAVQAEVAQGQQAVEGARARFLSLSEQGGKLQELRQATDEGLGLESNERIAAFNRASETLALVKDKPEKVFEALYSLAVREIRASREIVLSKGELLSGEKLRQGTLLRLGDVLALRDVPGPEGAPAIMLTRIEKNRRSFRWNDRLGEETALAVRKALESLSGPADSAKLVQVPGDILLSPLDLGDAGGESRDGAVGYVADLFEKGGALSWPIAALALLALLLSGERFVALNLLARRNSARLREAMEAAAKKAATREEAEGALEEILVRERPRLEKHLSTISVLGGAAPLLGLLGTVLGMIQLFDVITRYGTSDPKLLAGGIAVALVTTQLGLMVAIPVQLLHNYLANRADALASQAEEGALAILNRVHRTEA